MKLTQTLYLAAAFVGTSLLAACASTTQNSQTSQAEKTKSQITVIYDAFGKDPAMKKDWGFASLVEVGGKRILFDTGNDAETFAQNVKAKGIDLTRLDFVVMSHRHGDHMAGLGQVLAANPKVKIYGPKEGFGIYGFSLPSSFYRKNEALPTDMRYYDGKPPEVMKFGAAWADANFEPVDKTTEVAPGVWLIALVSDAPGTKELKELSLAIDTPDGIVLVVGCSHPGIENIVQAASKINKKIHFVTGGFHLVVAQDDVIARVAASLHDTWQVENIAPGHCTGEPTFAALRQAFSDHYLYAGVGTVLQTGAGALPRSVRGEAAVLAGDDLAVYRKFAETSHDAQDIRLAHAGHAHEGIE
jgi:7,8-dihydropterin-6-yl-methyl-4-(beta-D-ribofuranosyl)aminobenzene 5'-phosphate synthase